jgi:large subunit ribosomal protein L17
MRHRNNVNNLSRASDHRKALIHNLMKELIIHGSIVTTLPKAKAVRPYIEKLVTKGKSGTVAARRHIYSLLQDRKLSNKVVDEIAKGFANRPGGYTRILKLGQRRGDAAEVAIIQFIKE